MKSPPRIAAIPRIAATARWARSLIVVLPPTPPSAFARRRIPPIRARRNPRTARRRFSVTIAGFVGAASALLRYNFRVALVGAILSIFSIGPLGGAVFGGLAATGMILGAGDDAFRD